MHDSRSRRRLGVLYGEENDIDLQVSLKCHNMATKQTTHNDGCTLYGEKKNGERNRKINQKMKDRKSAY